MAYDRSHFQQREHSNTIIIFFYFRERRDVICYLLSFHFSHIVLRLFRPLASKLLWRMMPTTTSSKVYRYA